MWQMRGAVVKYKFDVKEIKLVKQECPHGYCGARFEHCSCCECSYCIEKLPISSKRTYEWIQRRKAEKVERHHIKLVKMYEPYSIAAVLWQLYDAHEVYYWKKDNVISADGFMLVTRRKRRQKIVVPLSYFGLLPRALFVFFLKDYVFGYSLDFRQSNKFI